MAKIAFFTKATWEKKFIEDSLKTHPQFKKHTFKFIIGNLTKRTAKKAADCDIVSVFVHDNLHNDTLEQLPKLKMIATRSTGYDHIDLDYCKKRKIIVCNVPVYGANTVAEHTFALLLSMSRKIPESVNKIKIGHFDREGIRGFDLFGKTLGVIGTGNIGANVIRMAHGFGMNIIAFDVVKHKELIKQYKVKYKSINEVFKEADILTFHVPLNPHTQHMLNRNNIDLLKPGVHIVNTSRGGVIETKGLIYGLHKKIIAGVALDVLENESFIQEESVLLDEKYLDQSNHRMLLEEHILTEQDNVYITPHNAFNSQEALERILITTMDNVEAFLKKKPINKVA